MLKKILTFALALLVVASMAACSNDKPDDQKDDPTNPDQQGETPGTPDNPDDPDDPDTPDNPDDTQTPTDPEDQMTVVNEEVYATVTVDLRSAPEVSTDNVVGVLRYGQRATRVKVSDEWSKIVYQENEYFVASNCVALYTSSVVLPGDKTDTPDPDKTDDPSKTDTPVTPTPDLSDFTKLEKSESVYVIAETALNLRTAPNTSAESKMKVGFGVKLERVAMNDSWSQVIYRGETYYAYSKFLTNEDISGEGYTELAAPKTMYVTATALWVRYYPSMSDEAKVSYTVLDGLHYGETVQCVAISPDNVWARIVIDGNQYYVGYKHLSDTHPDSKQ